MKFTVAQRIGIQIGIWFCIGFLIPFFASGGNLPLHMYPRMLTTLFGAILIVMINVSYLFPTYYKTRKIKQFILFLLVIIFTLGTIKYWIVNHLFESSAIIVPIARLHPQGELAFHLIGSYMPLIIFSLASTLFELAGLAHQKDQEAIQLRNEKLESELKFLKSQINPHFLFNSLNNIYSLTLFDAQLAGASVLKLSEMLRYLLYECDAEKVAIGKELAYLENYIDLFMLKEEEKLNISFDIGEVDSGVLIAPLLLIPFLENAFKHSQIEDVEKGWIKAKLIVNKQYVQFEVKNSLPSIPMSKDKSGGIGLQNVKRQLQLLYPDSHKLQVYQESDYFITNLHIAIGAYQ